MSTGFENWMSYLKDEARLVETVLPGAHNACTAGANGMARCQNDGVGDQLRAGIRHFCIRLDTDRKGTLYAVHGVTKCRPLAETLQEIGDFVDTHPSEFFILDIQEYYPQNLGPITLTYHADPAAVDGQIARYLDPARYAFTDFTDVRSITMGDIRRSGKRYMLYNHRGDYRYSVAPPCIRPWDKKIYGLKSPAFLRALPEFLLQHETEGLYWFQIQPTPNLGTEIGLSKPEKLEGAARPYYDELFRTLADERYLSRLNVVEGDFMTDTPGKIAGILRLNAAKNLIQADKKEAFLRELG